MRYNLVVLLTALLLISCVEPKKGNKINHGNTLYKKESKNVTMDTIKKELLLGLFSPSEHIDFVEVDSKYGDRKGHILHKECYKAFVDMAEAASADGVTLIIKSATRNHEYQKGIWERKWTGKTKLSDGTDCRQIKDPTARALRILEYSSMPGSSRHHWGTDLDLNAFNNAYFETGKGLEVYTWLTTNAHKYGFCQPYDDKSMGRTGYNEEKWHWSYTPLSKKYTQSARLLLSNSDMQNFLGYETAEEIDVVNNYILGIHSSCH